MPRCPECSKVVIVVEKPQRLRTWSSRDEMVSLAQKGCLLCAYPLRRLDKGTNYTLTNFNQTKFDSSTFLGYRKSEIHLEYDGEDLKFHATRWKSPSSHRWPVLSSATDGKSWGPTGEGRGIFGYYEADEDTTCDTSCTTRRYSEPGVRPGLGPRVVPFCENGKYSWPKEKPDPVLRARKLFHTCLFNDDNAHDNCGTFATQKSSFEPDSLPKRLLDLSHGDTIFIIDIPAWIDSAHATVTELSNYCTLSYQWGTRTFDCMLGTPFTDRHAITFSDMPQTFKDAIIVARALDTRFLWIDALCIVQGSVHGDYTDWKAEGPRMNVVYQNSRFTIAATCSGHPTDGFLSKSGIKLIGYVPCDVLVQEENEPPRFSVLSEESKDIHIAVVRSDLNRRGWVAQESSLSRRLLHFTEYGVYWECYATGTQLASIDSEEGSFIGHATLWKLSHWLRFLGLYSQSKFTYPTDRLIALSSIAKAVSVEEFGTEYYAGIWRKNLIDGLMWHSEEPSFAASRSLLLSIAPSWSWASVAGEINYEAPNSAHKLIKTWIEVQDVQVSFTQADNPYGDLTHGRLRLLARLCDKPLLTEDSPHLTEINGTEICFYRRSYWDEEQDESVVNKVYTVIPVAMEESLLSAYVYGAMIVEKAAQTSGSDENGESWIEYRRIGWLRYEPKPFGPIESALFFDTLFPHTTEPRTVIVV